MNLEILRELPAREWDALLRGGQGVIATGFLRACETTLPGLRWAPMIAREGAELVAVAPGFVHEVDVAAMLPAAAGAAARALRRLSPRLLRARVLELGPPCCPGPPLVAGDRRAAAAILRGVCAEVDAGRADLAAVRDLAGAGGAAEELLRELGFVLLSVRDTFVVDAGFATFDDYLGAMRAPYRRRAMQQLRRDLRVRVVGEFADLADPIARLIGLTTERSSESRLEIVDAEVVRRWSACGQTAAILIERGGDLLVAGLILVDPPVIHFLRCGFDERAGRESGGYLRLLYELVRHAIARGCRHVDLGVTSAEPKLRVGARPVPLRVWARHRSRPVQAALRALAAARPPHRSAEPRHVFREPRPPIEPSWYGPLA